MNWGASSVAETRLEGTLTAHITKPAIILKLSKKKHFSFRYNSISGTYPRESPTFSDFFSHFCYLCSGERERCYLGSNCSFAIRVRYFIWNFKMQPKSVLVPPDSQTWKLGNRYTRKDLKTVWDLSEGVWVPRTRNEKSLFLYILRAPLWKSWRKRVRVKTSGPLAAAAAPQPPPLPENSASLPDLLRLK